MAETLLTSVSVDHLWLIAAIQNAQTLAWELATSGKITRTRHRREINILA